MNLADWGWQGFPDIVRMPLDDYNVNCRYTKDMYVHGFRELLMRKYGEDNFVLNILEFHPDSLYLESKKVFQETRANRCMTCLLIRIIPAISWCMILRQTIWFTGSVSNKVI